MRHDAASHAMRRFIYVLTGPSGAYVGCTTDVFGRVRGHFAQARFGRYVFDQPVHVAMRADGPEHYSAEVVACAPNHAAGLLTERAVIARLHAFGVPLLNVHGVPGEPRKGFRPWRVMLNGGFTMHTRCAPMPPASVRKALARAIPLQPQPTPALEG